MYFFGRGMKSIVVAGGLAFAAVLMAKGQDGERSSFGFESIGARFGVGSNRISRDFWQSEALVDFTTPLQLNLGRDWTVRTRVGIAFGGFGNNHKEAFIGSVGPLASLRKGDFPLALEVGMAPTGVSEREYETRSIGSEFQIRSQAGLTWTTGKRVRLAYYFQHMSNGGITDNNQGMNMHMVSVAYCF